MISAIEILNRMHIEWVKKKSQTIDEGEGERETMMMRVLFTTLAFLHDTHLSEYKKLKNQAAKIGHFRQLFTAWKAACVRLERFSDDYPFYSSQLDAARAFPVFFEEMLPELYYVLYKSNVFLGVKFTEEDKFRFQLLEEKFLRDAIERERKQTEDIFMRMMFGSMMPKASIR